MAETLARWVRILAEPELTAKFQRQCGIRGSPVAAHESNGVNGSAHITTNNNIGDGVKIRNGNLASTSNGKSDHHINGILKDRSTVNGISKPNGVAGKAKAAGENGFADESAANGHCDHRTYTINNTALYWLFSFGAGLGNELFYTLFFSFGMWSFDSLVLRKTMIVWVVNMYVGQLAKDIIRLPRPNSPPVFRLEERYELEYGMPSTHAMVGFVLPFGMLYYMSGRYEFNFMVGLLIAITWCTLVCFSRMYLGMHSALDVIVGVLFAAILMLVTIPFVDTVDTFLISHPLSVPVAIATCLLLAFMYPRVDRWSTTRGDTMQALGVFTGILEGMWMCGQWVGTGPKAESLPRYLTIPASGDVVSALLRQVIGTSVVFVSMVTVKAIILHTMCWWLKLDPRDPASKRRYAIEMPYKYVSFFVSCAIGAFLMPVLFWQLNIVRPSMFAEILNYSV